MSIVVSRADLPATRSAKIVANDLERVMADKAIIPREDIMEIYKLKLPHLELSERHEIVEKIKDPYPFFHEPQMWVDVLDPKFRNLELPWVSDNMPKVMREWVISYETGFSSYKVMKLRIYSPRENVDERVKYLKSRGCKIVAEPDQCALKLVQDFTTEQLFIPLVENRWKFYITRQAELWPKKMACSTDPKKAKIVENTGEIILSRSVDGYFDFENCNIFQRLTDGGIIKYDPSWFGREQPLLIICNPYTTIFLHRLDFTKPIRYKTMMLQLELRRELKTKVIYQEHVRYRDGYLEKWIAGE